MPTYILIAPLKKNLSGITSKGYIILRKGNSVTVKYGPINSKTRKFYWAGKRMPTILTKNFKTKDKAILYYNSKIRMVESEEYKKLPTGKRILKSQDL